MDRDRSPGVAAPKRGGGLTRERILESAVELIAERGYSATSVEALCRRAGVVKTALYWHFGSKEGLLAAALERVASTWIEEIQKSVYQAGTPEERLDRAVRGMRAVVEERPELLRLLLSVAYERTEVAPETRALLRGLFQRAERALVEGIEDALGMQLPDLDLVAQTALALLHAASLRQLVDPEGTDLDRLFADLRRTMVLLVASRIEQPRAPDPEETTS